VPGVREQEQSANTQQRAVAREEPGVLEQRREQEQPANTRQLAATREEPGVREQRREQEQTANTRQRAVAREVSHIRRPVLGVLRSYRNTISRGNNLMAPERIQAARASQVHTV